MNLLLATKLLHKFESCPQCGNNKVGNGQGTLEITEEHFIRTCKCGFKVTIDKRENEVYDNSK